MHILHLAQADQTAQLWSSSPHSIWMEESPSVFMKAEKFFGYLFNGC